MKKQRDERFKEAVWKYYRLHGRHDLPWRNPPVRRQGRANPYRILVSEVMLQQTQVDRVAVKYKDFLKQFPSVRALANASLGDVLRAWQGLGYNRRAKMLHESVKALAARGSRFPRTYEELLQLPGVGPYTAGAVMAFSYNEPVPIIETNIRTVYLHHFFEVRRKTLNSRGENAEKVSDTDILRLVERTLDRENPREWYWALMDYGAYLKKTVGSQNARSRHYAKQSRFTGSDREIRGAVLRTVADVPHTKHQLVKALSFEPVRLGEQLAALVGEGMIINVRGKYSLPQ